MSAPLWDLADALGIARGYAAFSGAHQATGPDTIRALAAALGHPAATDAEAAASLARLQAERAARLVPDYRVLDAGVPVELHHPGRHPWVLLDVETGRLLRAGQGRQIAPEGLAFGRYRLRFDGDPSPGTLLLVRPPGRPRPLRKAWGVMAPLYGLRSSRNTGLGDYRDLAALAMICGQEGADFVGINPVHALRTSDSSWFSPYSPNHRGFWNTRHLALDAIEGFDDSEAARSLLARAARQLEAAHAAPELAYDRIDAIRGPVLEALFAAFRALPASSRLRRRFDSWRAEQGPALESFAIFEALLERHGNDPGAWPDGFAHAGDIGVAPFAKSASERVLFHQWLQFEADRQLAAAAGAARASGQRIGLYFDVAVGTVVGSAEVWAEPRAFAPGVSLGAPPDHFNPMGQAWHLAPLHPHRLMDADAGPLVSVLRAAMRHAGMVRIDHILGLFRSFWVPLDGTTPGSYVHYPFDGLLALLAIEAARAGTQVVGEDLGLVPDGFRDRLAGEGILGCTVMQFERGNEGFHDPGGYRTASVGCVATHDVPTLRGWWLGTDIDAMQAAGLVDEAGAAAMSEDRDRARSALWQLLADRKLLGAGADRHHPPASLDAAQVRACHRLLARSPVAVAAVQLDDMLGVERQQNLPGTVNEHPNWRRRLPVDIPTLAGDAEWRATCAALRRDRPRPNTEHER